MCDGAALGEALQYVYADGSVRSRVKDLAIVEKRSETFGLSMRQLSVVT